MATSIDLTPEALAHLASDLRLACMRISRRVRYESTSGIAPHQFSVLVRLADGPATPGDLAETEKVSKPSMTRTLSGLAELGLVGRTPDPSDGRQVIVALTPHGRHTLEATRRRRDAWMAARILALPADEQQVLARAEAILSRVANE